MRSSTHDAVVWDFARPARPSRVAGVRMGGIRVQGMLAGGYRLVPHAAVTLVLDFGAGPTIVDDDAGRERRGSLAAGLGLPAWFGRVMTTV